MFLAQPCKRQPWEGVFPVLTHWFWPKDSCMVRHSGCGRGRLTATSSFCPQVSLGPPAHLAPTMSSKGSQESLAPRVLLV